jgi:hypothetical protein
MALKYVHRDFLHLGLPPGIDRKRVPHDPALQRNLDQYYGLRKSVVKSRVKGRLGRNDGAHPPSLNLCCTRCEKEWHEVYVGKVEDFYDKELVADRLNNLSHEHGWVALNGCKMVLCPACNHKRTMRR